jgi:hypothetical protein
MEGTSVFEMYSIGFVLKSSKQPVQIITIASSNEIEWIE